MRKIQLLGVSLAVVSALLALTASDAFAEEKTKMLPEGSVTFSSKNVAAIKLIQAGTAETVECKKATGSGTIESANAGKYTLDLQECKLLGGACTSIGDAAGVILSEGTYRFWLALETLNGTPETLVGALVILPNVLHFTCNVLGINELELALGCIAALAKSLNTLVATTEDVYAQSGGVQLITKVLPAEATVESECKLLISINGGGFVQSALEGTIDNEKFKKGETAITVLLMNPEAHE